MNTALNSRSLLERRDAGVFYTPQGVADTIANWAIRSTSDSVLEPGFGGCGFIEASCKRLTQLDCSNPLDKIYGCDTDPHAFSVLSKLEGIKNNHSHFIKDDFLKLRNDDFVNSNKFSVVVGNPPYVSLHTMSESQKKTAEQALFHTQFQLNKRASLWAYFVLHSHSFLIEGARVGWVLPASYIYANYAKSIRQYFKDNFTKVVEITMEERLFTSIGASERTVVILAEGFTEKRDQECQVLRSHAKNSKELETIVNRLVTDQLCNEYLGLSEGQRAKNTLAKIPAEFTSSKLGDHLDLKIGIVTGSNKFFIKTKEEWGKSDIHINATYPIVGKFSQICGLELTDSDLIYNKKTQERCLLLNSSGKREPSKAIAKYLSTFPVKAKQNNATFKKRPLWYAPDDKRTPDGFFSYMCHDGPRLALNEALTTSTNTVHRVYFLKSTNLTMKRMLALSLLSTASQLSSEIEGRSYGSGVLKFEPSEARRISVFLPEKISSSSVSKIYFKVDKLMRESKKKEVERLVDEFIFGETVNSNMFSEMREALVKLRVLRREPKRSR